MIFIKHICFTSILLWLYDLCWTLPDFFQFLNLYVVSRTPWTSDQLVARPLPKHTTTQTQENTYTHH
jgi:hypothetical protein